MCLQYDAVVSYLSFKSLLPQLRLVTEARDRSGPTNQKFCQDNKLWVKCLLSMMPFTYDNKIACTSE